MSSLANLPPILALRKECEGAGKQIRFRNEEYFIPPKNSRLWGHEELLWKDSVLQGLSFQIKWEGEC